MPATDWGWLVSPEELRSWIVGETDDLLVVNKPPFVVCHPSKRGPWSSLVGACREHFALERVHPVFRLDRETSGVVLIAKNQPAASRFQNAMQRHSPRKTYWAILCGNLPEQRTVIEPLGRDLASEYACRQCVTLDGKRAETEFVPLAAGCGYTLVRVHPRTGRLHQIRVHAAWMGHPVAGDKLYPDAGPMLEFIKSGFTPRLQALLPHSRQALHAAEIEFEMGNSREVFRAPLAADLVTFCRDRMGLSWKEPP